MKFSTLTLVVNIVIFISVDCLPVIPTVQDKKSYRLAVMELGSGWCSGNPSRLEWGDGGRDKRLDCLPVTFDTLWLRW